jgi:hypothetical protein
MQTTLVLIRRRVLSCDSPTVLATPPGVGTPAALGGAPRLRPPAECHSPKGLDIDARSER